MAREQFWQLLVELSRCHGVTIFVSTHYLSEATRCDRVALMNAGRVLACDSPGGLLRARGAETLEQVFVACIREDLQGPPDGPAEGDFVAARSDTVSGDAAGTEPPRLWSFDPRRLGALVWREALEIRRDPVRLLFSLLVPVLLLIVFGYGLSLDVENLPFAALDRDRTPESRFYLEQFSGSRYFREHFPVHSQDELDRRMKQGELKVAIEIPPGFARDLRRGREPSVGVWLDGTMPFRAETARGYAEGLHRAYLADQSRRVPGIAPQPAPVQLEIRFRYNQGLKSKFAVVPGLIAVVLVIVPSILTAVGVVREKELGTITNLYVTPVTRLEFLWGKQLLYVGISAINFLMLAALAVLLFGVPFKGSFVALVMGAFLGVTASTGIGLLVSAFARTQIAALLATVIITIIPAFQYSGLLTPVASLEGSAAAFAHSFPAGSFLNVSVGAFAKGLGSAALLPDYVALAATIVVLTTASALLLGKQES
jgi:ribosome-dependent ATPase